MREPTSMHSSASDDKLLHSRPDGHILAVALPILIAAALAWWHVSSSAAESFSRQKPSRIDTAVDAAITPGDDFFGYANGEWLKAAALPAGKQRWGARDELEEKARRRIAELLDNAGAAPAG